MNGNSTSSKTTIAVAPVWMHALRTLIFTIIAMAVRLTTRITMFKILLPMGRVNTSAIMQIKVTMRNMRSRILIL